MSGFTKARCAPRDARDLQTANVGIGIIFGREGRCDTAVSYAQDLLIMLRR
jgi:hypothetical protein